jgi:Domain of unknown function (DUF4365)
MSFDDMSDSLLAATDIQEALSRAYAHAVAAAAGYVVSMKDFDRDSIDMTFEAGGSFRPKIDAQLKATTNLPSRNGCFHYPCPIRNYNHLRISTQTPRILVILYLPPEQDDWIKLTAEKLIMRNCAYWVSLLNATETENTTTVTINIPHKNQFDHVELKRLMELSRTGTLA